MGRFIISRAQPYDNTPFFDPIVIQLAMLGSRASLIFLLALPLTHSIYFHVSHGTKRCFLEEMPGQTLFLATYKNPDYKPFGAAGYTDGTAVIIRVLDPSGATVLSRTADVTGKIAFHSTQGGEYQLCFNTNSSYYSGAQKFVRARSTCAGG